MIFLNTEEGFMLSIYYIQAMQYDSNAIILPPKLDGSFFHQFFKLMKVVDIFLSVGVTHTEREDNRANRVGNNIPKPIHLSGIKTTDYIYKVLSSAHVKFPFLGFGTSKPWCSGRWLFIVTTLAL